MDKREIEALIENSTCLVNEVEIVKAFAKIMTEVEGRTYEIYRCFIMEEVPNERGNRTLPLLYHYILPSDEVCKIKNMSVSADREYDVESVMGVQIVDREKIGYDAIVQAGEGIRIDNMNFFRKSSRLIDGVDDSGHIILSSSLPDFGRYGYLKLFILYIVREQIGLGRKINRDELTCIAASFSPSWEKHYKDCF